MSVTSRSVPFINSIYKYMHRTEYVQQWQALAYLTFYAGGLYKSLSGEIMRVVGLMCNSDSDVNRETYFSP